MIYQGSRTYQVNVAQNYAVSGGSAVTSIVRTEITVAGRAATIHEATTGDVYLYHISDHLGNVRVSFSVNTNHTVSVESYTDYYASGWEMPGRTYTSANRTRFGYQGAFTENDADLGMTTFDLRAYDARLMRWHNPDPYQEFHSPYCAMGNDWVNGVDPSGGTTGGGNNPNFWGKVAYFFGARKKFFRDGSPVGGYHSNNTGGFDLDLIKLLLGAAKGQVYVHFVRETDTKWIYEHTVKAIEKRLPIMKMSPYKVYKLRRHGGGKDESRKRRIEAMKSHPRSCEDEGYPGCTRDEFPYASTIEGGAGADVACVPVDEQNRQKTALSELSRFVEPGQPYLVITIPAPTPTPIPGNIWPIEIDIEDIIDGLKKFVKPLKGMPIIIPIDPRQLDEYGDGQKAAFGGSR